MKRLFVLLMVCALCAGSGALAMAEPASVGGGSSASIVGNWAMSGKVTISATFTGIVTISATLPNIAIFDDVFTFDTSGDFSDSLLGITGTYVQTGSTFTVDISDYVSSLVSALESLLSGYGVTASISVVSESFTGKVTSATKSTDSFSIVIQASVPGSTPPISGQVTLSATKLSGTLVSTASANLPVSVQTPQSIANHFFEKVLVPVLGVPAN